MRKLTCFAEEIPPSRSYQKEHFLKAVNVLNWKFWEENEEDADKKTQMTDSQKSVSYL